MLIAFDGRYFRSHGILPSHKVQLGGNTMLIKVKAVDAPLDYNLLLVHNWIYNMRVDVSSLFQIICFPFEDRIVTVEHKTFDNSSMKASSRTTILVIDNSQLATKNIGVGMYPSLMGTLNIFHTNSYHRFQSL